VIPTANIHTSGAPAGINGMTNSFEVSAIDWPLYRAGALNAFIDQRARELASKEIQDAKKQGGDLKDWLRCLHSPTVSFCLHRSASSEFADEGRLHTMNHHL
jgi:hypothetical protein